MSGLLILFDRLLFPNDWIKFDLAATEASLAKETISIGGLLMAEKIFLFQSPPLTSYWWLVDTFHLSLTVFQLIKGIRFGCKRGAYHILAEKIFLSGNPTPTFYWWSVNTFQLTATVSELFAIFYGCDVICPIWWRYKPVMIRLTIRFPDHSFLLVVCCVPFTSLYTFFHRSKWRNVNSTAMDMPDWKWRHRSISSSWFCIG